MGDKQFAKEPLLYIHQPQIQKPAAPMQYQYHTPTEQLIEKEDKHVHAKESHRDSSTNTKFKNMTLKQKIAYFTQKSEHVPKMQCLIRAGEKTYQGIITDFKNEEVYVKVGRRQSVVQISFDQITSIQMVGF